MSAPMPTLPEVEGATEWMCGLPCGPFELALANGTRLMPLPLYAFPGEMGGSSSLGVQQAPGARGTVLVGFDTLTPLRFVFGSNEASSTGLLEFRTVEDRADWVRMFNYACVRARRFVFRDVGEECDGKVVQFSTSVFKVGTKLKFSLTFQSVDPFPWLSEVITVTGTPAECPNSTPEYAYPRVTLTAAATTVTITDGEGRTLEVTATVGQQVVVDSAIADGRVTAGGLLTLHDGLFPRVEPGGGTLTVTGAATGSVNVSYRMPALALPVISTTPPGPGGGGAPAWNLVSSNGPNGGVILSEPGLTSSNGGGGGVVLSGSGLASANGPNGGVILS